MESDYNNHLIVHSAKDPVFSVFTPTYNRAAVLPRVFEALARQTFTDFEWVIVDDGSADDTKVVVDKWIKEAAFPVRYQWQANQGKHIAFNTAAGLVKGKLFICVDSDDELIPEALEILLRRWQKIDLVARIPVAGIMFLCKDQHGNLVGDRFPEDGEVADLIKTFLVQGVTGEKGSVFRTDVLKEHLFPTTQKNVYVPESVMLQNISRSFRMLCINDVLRIYWIDERTDHLGSEINTTRNLAGDRLANLAMMNYSTRLFTRVPRLFLANAAYYTRASLYLGINLPTQWKDIKTFSGKLCWLITLPLGFIMYKKIRS